MKYYYVPDLGRVHKAVRHGLLCLAVLMSGSLHAGTLETIRALEANKTATGTAPAMNEAPLHREVLRDAVKAVPASPVWYPLSDGRRVDLREWTLVLFMQSSCSWCQKFDPVLKAFSQKSGLTVFPVSMDGRGDAAYPDVLPATPDVMVDFFQGGLPVATPTTFLTRVNTMETWPLLQGAAEEPELRARLDEVLRMALDRQAGKPLPVAPAGGAE